MKRVTVSGLVRRRSNEGRPVFAVDAAGGIHHVGYTSRGFKVYDVPDDAVVLAYPLLGNHDAAICAHEPTDGMPERGTVATWRHKDNFKQAVAELLGVPVQSEAVNELLKRVARFVR